MITDIIIPKLGAEMQSANIDEWKRDEGSWIDINDAILVIQTEKITNEIEAPASGYLHILGREGTEYEIGKVVAQIAESKEEYQRLQSMDSNHKQEKQNDDSLSKHEERQKASPLARKMAKDKAINLADVCGSGSSGAILKRDILEFQGQQKESENTGLLKKEQSDNLFAQPVKKIKEIHPLKGMRKVIAETMMKSLQSTAQMTDINEIDVHKLVAFRDSINEELQEELGFKISYNDLFIKIVATILRRLPILNASIQNEQIIIWENINIGIAVAVENGLIVPVIKNTDKLSLGEIHKQSNTLIEKARKGTLTPDQIADGTFTITNFGSFGGYFGTPILNLPEVGILGIGAISQKPVVRDGEIVIGEVLGYSFTVDHRLIDGKIAGDFQNEFKRIINNPKILFV
ncbi:dihydrolipoamide acetyltransferase family protein [Viridibacillus sp. NPDC093762]|uniref:dihydrolipoamide acetyltransferase family protein n=1 Tax=Viridibacillus sp. NPDC093762 TaxID=3390720 RepID=UPI003D039878